jgi:hypothetical protein
MGAGGLEQTIELILAIDVPKEIKHTALLMLRPYLADIVGKLAFEITALAPIEIIWRDSGHHLFIHDAASDCIRLRF